MKNMMRPAIIAAFAAVVFAAVAFSQTRHNLLINAHILTMNEAYPTADAMLFRGGKLIAIGEESTLRQELPAFTRLIDMSGKTIVPGFIDGHSHFPSSGLVHAGLDLTPPPMGTVATLQNLLEVVSQAEESVDAGDWIIGFNYDDANLTEARHPSRAELDVIAPDNPVYLWHRSGHMGVANTKALQVMVSDMDDILVNQKRLAAVRRALADSSHQGLLQEDEAASMRFLLDQISYRRLLSAFLSARDEYLAAGITTAQNGFADIATMRLLKWAQRLGVLPMRLIMWPAHKKVANKLAGGLRESSADDTEQNLAEALDWSSDSEDFFVSAIKLIADGSPQGRTAWVTQPYLGEYETGRDRGFPHLPPDDFTELVKRYHNSGFHLAIHGNGDAAIDLIMEAIETAQRANPRADARHVLVHGQLVRPDQLQKLAALDISVSFFPAHTFFWGDWYKDVILDRTRAERITPLSLAQKEGVKFSLHSDAPVTPISPLDIMWSATTRETFSGAILGAEFAISPERALRALTIDAAWQNRTEHDRGSLEVGKLADFVVLSGDPLTSPDVRKLTVDEVWIDGSLEFAR